MPRAWVIRATDSGMQWQVEDKSATAVGWSLPTDVAQVSSLREMLTLFEKHPTDKYAKPLALAAYARQLHVFVNEVARGDYVLTPLNKSQTILIGTITGDYVFDASIFSIEHPHTRSTQWLRKVRRTELSPQAVKTLSTPPTVVCMDRYLGEITRLVNR